MKKTNQLLLSLAVLSVGVSAITSCSEADNLMPPASLRPATQGDAVCFSTYDMQTRTAYGEDEDRFQLYWLDGDSIVLFSEQAFVGAGMTPTNNHQANYTVTIAEDDLRHGVISPFTANDTMRWGDVTQPHTFYGVYPHKRFVKSDQTGFFTMEYHTNQVCTLEAPDNGFYNTVPDMNNAYMVAKKTVQDPQDPSDHVLLDFDPIMTTLDITVKAGKYEVGTGIIQPVTVTGVSVIMPSHLNNGEFTYDISQGERTTANSTVHLPEWGLKDGIVKSGTESVFVGLVDDEMNPRAVDLLEGESVKVMAFLPPMNADHYEIKVHTTTGYDFIKKVNASDLKDENGKPVNGNGNFLKRSRIDITLPHIYPEGADNFDGTPMQAGNNWMSKLSENTKIKNLSLPGYECEGNITPDQIEYLLNRGVRALDLTAIGIDSDNMTQVLGKIKEYLADRKEFVLLFHKEWQYGLKHNRPLDYVFNSNGYHVNIPNTLKDVSDQKIIALQRSNTDVYFYTTYEAVPLGEINCVFGGYKNVEGITDKFDLSKTEWANNGSKCGVQYLKDTAANKSVYQSIAGWDSQTGCAGVVMVKNALNTYENGNSTYSDLLMQAVIDMNFKVTMSRD